MAIYLAGTPLSEALGKINATESESAQNQRALSDFMDDASALGSGIEQGREVAANLLSNMRDIERHF